MKALIDADVLCYEIGFMAQRVDKETGEIAELLAEPVVLKILEDKIYDIADKSECSEFRLYLSSAKKNFRYDVAKTKPYKGNRSSPKPFYFESIRNYLIEQFSPVMEDGVEADDMLRIDNEASGRKCVIASIDKDLDQAAGYHYNWRKDSLYEVSEDGANCWFWAQTLIGDVADNIGGVWKMGPKRSVDLLINKTNEERRQACHALYVRDYKEDADRMLQENGTLLHILRYPDDEFNWKEYE